MLGAEPFAPAGRSAPLRGVTVTCNHVIGRLPIRDANRFALRLATSFWVSFLFIFGCILQLRFTLRFFLGAGLRGACGVLVVLKAKQACTYQ